MAPILPVDLTYAFRRRAAYLMQFLHLMSFLFGLCLIIFGFWLYVTMGQLSAGLGGSYGYGFIYYAIFVAIATNVIHFFGLRVTIL